MGLVKKITVSWSGGKDSSFALYKVLQDPAYEVESLHTTFDAELHRVGMHGIREELVEAQAKSIGIHLDKIYIEKGSSNENYEKALAAYYLQKKEQGVQAVVFGDIFLEDLRNYRIALMKKFGLECIFPLWGENTAFLSKEYIKAGFKSQLCCMKSEYFVEEDLLKLYDLSFLKDITKRMDPCGENGEFHTFVFDGPVFKTPVLYKTGERIIKTYEIKTANDETIQTPGFWFVDLLPA